MLKEDERQLEDGVLPIVCADWLIGKAKNVHSQFGEDGLLQAIFDRIGIANEWCFEVGAYDGIGFSNACQFIEKGWNAVMIEADEETYGILAKNYGENPRVRCVHDYVEPWNIDAVLDRAEYPWDGDLGIIDIDEQDFWVWAGMHYVHPRVMVVEFGLGRPSHQVPPLRSDQGTPVRELQAGRDMIYAMGTCKGYHLLAITTTNMIFVARDVWS